MSTYDSEYLRGIQDVQSGVATTPPANVPAPVKEAYLIGRATAEKASSDKGGSK
jgi:hypothetical protein